MRRQTLIILTVLLFTFPVLAQSVLEIGSPAPSLSLPDLAGNKVVLDQYLGTKVVILGFFTSWSKSGQEQSLFLNSLHKKYAKKGLQVLGISFDRKPNLLKSFVNNNKLGFEILYDKKLKTLRDFRIIVIPTLFVIDQSGKIKNVYMDFDDNVKIAAENEIKQLLTATTK